MADEKIARILVGTLIGLRGLHDINLSKNELWVAGQADLALLVGGLVGLEELTKFD